MNKVRKGGK